MDLEEPITYRFLVNKELEYYVQITPEFINKLFLNPGESICSSCGGLGWRPISKTKTEICNRCNGERKLNWIEFIFNKNI